MPTLDWLDRNRAFATAAQVPYRLLEPVATHGDDASGNLLVQGDNLEALKSLLPLYRGQVKCIFIDPPYNTKSAFEHYDDNLEHAQWLSMMLPRLQLLREFLREDGSIWVTIDDHEGHYLKVLMDEVFGRNAFVAAPIWRSSDNSNNDAKTFSVDHNQVLVYGATAGWAPYKTDDNEDKRTHFTNPDNDPRGPWFDGNPLNSPKPRPNLMYRLEAPNGTFIDPPRNGWRWKPETMAEKIALGEIRFAADMRSIKRRTYLADMEALPPSTLWVDLEVTGHNRQAKSEQKQLHGMAETFATPKPERFLRRCLALATNPNDLVLDSFLGSGTTAAVAHKMGRRWIGIEMGAHAETHCVPRLQKVIAGEQGGISAAVGWQGGGGFRFARLGAPVFGADGRIHPDVRFATLAGFVWQHETRTAWDARTARAGTPLLGVHSNCSQNNSGLPALDADCGPISPENTGAAASPAATAYYLLFNGILGDRRPAGGNVLTRDVLAALLALHADAAPPGTPLVVYGDACRLGPERLAAARVRFQQIPYDIPAR